MTIWIWAEFSSEMFTVKSKISQLNSQRERKREEKKERQEKRR